MTTTLEKEKQELVPIEKLRKDLRVAAARLSDKEARYLVDYYYLQQENRKRTGNQIRALGESSEPSDLIGWLDTQTTSLEHQIRNALGLYSQGHPVGRWAESITGIGPVISAGLLAHIDIKQAPTVGHIWRFAGLDPTQSWDKGEKRPWNAKLKVLCWKAGESFVKVSNKPEDVYGKVYAARKELETERNDAGAFAEQAAAKLEKHRIGKDTEAYKAYSTGKLPPAHIHARAKRYAVKLFLSSLHEVAYYVEYGKLPPRPYILSEPKHTHWFQAPNPDIVSGLREAQESARKEFMRGLLPKRLRRKNPERAKEIAQQSYLRNKERDNQRSREYYRLNRERLIRQQKIRDGARMEEKRAYNRQYQRTHRRPIYYRSYRLRTRYGLTPEAYDAMYLSQGGKCAICGEEEHGKARNGLVVLLSVDHNHDSGRVRGLLCRRCNAALGFVTNEEWMKAAHLYLHQAAQLVAK